MGVFVGCAASVPATAASSAAANCCVAVWFGVDVATTTAGLGAPGGTAVLGGPGGLGERACNRCFECRRKLLCRGLVRRRRDHEDRRAGRTRGECRARCFSGTWRVRWWKRARRLRSERPRKRRFERRRKLLRRGLIRR